MDSLFKRLNVTGKDKFIINSMEIGSAMALSQKDNLISYFSFVLSRIRCLWFSWQVHGVYRCVCVFVHSVRKKRLDVFIVLWYQGVMLGMLWSQIGILSYWKVKSPALCLKACSHGWARDLLYFPSAASTQTMLVDHLVFVWMKIFMSRQKQLRIHFCDGEGLLIPTSDITFPPEIACR